LAQFVKGVTFSAGMTADLAVVEDQRQSIGKQCNLGPDALALAVKMNKGLGMPMPMWPRCCRTAFNFRSTAAPSAGRWTGWRGAEKRLGTLGRMPPGAVS